MGMLSLPGPRAGKPSSGGVHGRGGGRRGGG